VRGYLALSKIYEEGLVVPRDLAKARSLLEEIAAAGDARGRYELTRFLTANGGADAETVSDDLAAAATSGSGSAMLSLSRRLDEGESTGGKDRQGWLAAAAEAGEVKAKIALARQGSDVGATEGSLDRVAAGGVCQPDQMADLAMAYVSLESDDAAAKAKVWLDRAVAVGDADPNVAFALGQALAAGTGGEELRAKGIALLTGLAEAGTLRAMRQLATGYASGAWGKTDKELASYWLERAAAAGDAPSAVDYAQEVAAAERPDPNALARAHGYLAKAANSSASAARQLGQLSMEGLFGEAERAEGSRWLQVAADAGDASAMRDMADMYSTGGGGLARDPERALEWLRKAAAAGDAKSMLKLGAAYEAGFGTEADATLADHWYAAARQAGIAVKQ
jgi:TPR repeat protein